MIKSKQHLFFPSSLELGFTIRLPVKTEKGVKIQETTTTTVSTLSPEDITQVTTCTWCCSRLPILPVAASHKQVCLEVPFAITWCDQLFVGFGRNLAECFWEGDQASGFSKLLGDTVSQLQHGDRNCHLPPYPQNPGTLRVNLGSTTRLSSKTLPRWQGELHTLMAMQLLPPVLAPAIHAHGWRLHSWAHCQALCDPGRVAVSAYPLSHFKNQHSNA